MIPPPAPDFGEPCPIRPSAETLAFLATRRSASAMTLRAPGPDAGEIEAQQRLAARAPDHGKLAPWRFVVLEGDAKSRFVAALHRLVATQPSPEKAEAALAKIVIPPLSIAVVSSAKEAKIPLWEQELSAAACCMNLLIATQAMGFGANWITDWYAYDPEAAALLGVREGERVAGYVHIGTPAETPLERVRPNLSDIVERWNG